MNTQPTIRPRSIEWAINLLWISAGILALASIAAIADLISLRLSTEVAIINFVTVGFMVFCAIKFRAGRSWPRWLYLAIFLIGALDSVFDQKLALQGFFALPVWLILVGATQTTVQIAILVLVFSPNSRAWFRARRQERKAAL